MARHLSLLVIWLGIAPAIASAQSPTTPPPQPDPLPPPLYVGPGAAGSVGPDRSELVTVELRDSQLVRGYIVAQTREHVIIHLISGGEMAIAHTDIKTIKHNDETVFVSDTNELFKHDPNRTRYLYGPSAFMLRKGEGYFSQTELMISTIGYGATDWLTIQVGSVLPVLFAGEGNMIVGAKVGFPVSERFHLAAGTHALIVPDEGAIGLMTGTATFGTPRAHVSVSASVPFASDDDGSGAGPMLLSVSGNVRASKHVAFVSENWLLDGDDETLMLGSLATRFLGEHVAVDVGMILIEDFEVPIPWLDFTWNWD